MKRLLLALLFLLSLLPWALLTDAFGQVTPGSGVLLRDEGSNLGRAITLDCVGAGIACTLSGGVGTLTVSGGGGGGGVTEVDTTGPITGGPITTTGTIDCPTCAITGTTAITINGQTCTLGGSCTIPSPSLVESR